MRLRRNDSFQSFRSHEIFRLGLGLFVVLALMGPVESLQAQDADPTAAAAARALFGEGVSAADAEDWGTAADRFRQALALRASPTIALNLAVALGHRGQVVEATELLRGVLRAPDASAAVLASAQETLTALEPRLSWLRLSLRGSTEGVAVRIDDRLMSQALLSAAIPLDPGEHRVSAVRGEGEIAHQSVALAEGESGEAVLVLPEFVPEPEILPEPVDEPEPDDEAPAEVPFDSGPDPVAVGLGVGAGVLVLGGVIALVVVLTLPQPAPFVGNAGILEVGP